MLPWLLGMVGSRLFSGVSTEAVAGLARSATSSISGSSRVEADVIAVDKGGKALFKRMEELNGACVDIGFFASAGAHPGSGMPMAAHAQELIMGDPSWNLPSRDFMTTTIDAQRGAILQATRQAVETIVKTRASVSVVMNQLGEFYENMIRENIKHGNWEGLSQRTINKKIESGSAHVNDILRDTDAMFDAISHQLRRA